MTTALGTPFDEALAYAAAAHRHQSTATLVIEAGGSETQAIAALLHDAAEDALLVPLADKVHNARSIVSDFRVEGARVWDRFNPGSDQGWYYGELARAFRARLGDHPLVAELEISVAELRRVAG